jgi:hypothetical protein
VIVVGAVMFILRSMGRRIGGRRDYWQALIAHAVR